MKLPPDTGWYWGELRGALSRLDWERVWEMVAAWPCPSPDREAALRHVLASSWDVDAEAAIGTSWLLKHYQETPVPLHVYNPLPKSTGTVRFVRGPLTLTGRGAGRDEVKVAVPGLNLCMRTLLSSASPSEPLVADLWVEGDDGYDTLVRRDGSTRRCDTPGATRHAGRVRVTGKKEILLAGELTERFGREVQALASGKWKLAWSRDVLEQLRLEGPEAHTTLRYVNEADVGVRTSAQEVSRSWQGEP